MITVTFYRQGEFIYGFKSTGHAYYDETGKDIVCAGVSAVLFSVAETLEEDYDVRVKIDDTKGSLSVKFKSDTFQNEIVQAIFRVALKGMEGIEREYSQFIELKSKEE
ncbi:ribosomal-processing cysteine protease Prp [Guggenheimella bovis]